MTDEVIEKVEALLLLVPYGEQNAISRKELTNKLVENGTIKFNVKDKDRAMRMLLTKAREDHVIITRPMGGYYRPSKEDAPSVRYHVEQERSRAIKTFKSIKHESKYLNDLERGRI